MSPPEVLTPEAFIEKIKTAPKWTLTECWSSIQLVFELQVLEGDQIVTYLSPDPLSMTELKFRLFMASLRRIAERPDVKVAANGSD
jgi:hypothetical protein